MSEQDLMLAPRPGPSKTVVVAARIIDPTSVCLNVYKPTEKQQHPFIHLYSRSYARQYFIMPC